MQNSTQDHGGHSIGGSWPTDPWRFQRWAFAQITGNAARKAVLSMLAMQADFETGRCEAKQATLAEGCELSERSVRSHIRTLEEAGFIARRAQYRRDGGRRGDEFLLLAPGVGEWPDGEVAGGYPADFAGGGSDGDLPGPPEADDHPPRKLASGQEQPLTNSLSLTTTVSQPTISGACASTDLPGRHHSSVREFSDPWEFAVPEMIEVGRALLAQKRKVAGRLVSDEEMGIAASALSEFNRQHCSQFELGPWFGEIVARVRDHPNYDSAAHVRLVQSAFRLRWWEQRGNTKRAKPGVVWGPNAFPNVVDDATREAQVRRERELDRDPTTKVYDGVRWSELTANQQAHVRESVSIGMRPWEAGGKLEPVVASASLLPALSAETFGFDGVAAA